LPNYAKKNKKLHLYIQNKKKQRKRMRKVIGGSRVGDGWGLDLTEAMKEKDGDIWHGAQLKEKVTIFKRRQPIRFPS
jgi:hypothetical protein